MNVAIIGCGLMGQRRVKALQGHKLVVACDLGLRKARQLCVLAGSGEPTTDWKKAAAHPKVDIVIVATSNDKLSLVGSYALKHGKHVLVEKPVARSLKELTPFWKQARNSKAKVKVGFNLRYHPALIKARQIVDSGVMGELMFIRGRYGHGGRLGYEKEWRADPRISGGGELLDQGVHMIDLCRWFLGDFVKVHGQTPTYFWKMPVEDNAFMALTTAKKQIAWLHVSWTEWKNMFSLEIYGQKGKIAIDGLGGSYGTERVTYYQMLPKMGPPKTRVWEFKGPDISWEMEFTDFVNSIKANKPLNGGIDDAYQAMKIIDQIYG